ncbi:hypothetical protein BH20ACI4_BH20ACI4_29460 [soil metagenome]
MTKREFVWLLIRLAGVYFAYLAIITFFTVVTSGWSVIFAPPKLDVPNANGNRSAPIPGIVQPAPYDINNPTATPATSTAEPEKPEDKAKREAVMSFLGGLLLALIYGGIGFYFLRDGRLLFALLMREESEKKKPSEPEVTTLNL